MNADTRADLDGYRNVGNSNLLLGDNMDQQYRKRAAESRWSWWHLLFLIQFVAVLWPPFYNKMDPSWIGIPFFFWYQLLWIIIGAILTAIVYFATDD